MKGRIPPGAPKEVYDAILTAQRALVEARGQLIESQGPQDLAHVLSCLHRVANQVEHAMKACARACSDADSGAT